MISNYKIGKLQEPDGVVQNWKLVLAFIFLFLTTHSFSQSNEEASIKHFRGAVIATNNGISLIPTFSLGAPAAIFDLSIGGERFSFDPELRFALEGKPWSFILWWRYKLLRSEKFNLNVGAHPAMVFKTIPKVNGTNTEIIAVQRYLAGELAPSYSISKNAKVGIYYLHSLGLETDAVRHTQFVAVNSTITNIPISKQLYFNVRPQFYYLKMDQNDGFYTNASLTLAKRNFPIAISSIINRAIRTNIPSKDLVWNISLVYTFNKEYVSKPLY